MTIPLVVDGNNYARILFEAETSGNAIRRLYTDIAYNNRPTIVVFDGKNAKAARRAIFPGYKVGRLPAPDQFYRILDFWSELLMHTHAIQIKVDGFEGDDVIHHLAHNTDGPLEIDSTDGDFCAFTSERVIQPKAPALKSLRPQDVRLYKALVGDTSDKIPGVKNFGPGGWLLLTEVVKTNIIDFLEGTGPWLNHLPRESHNEWAYRNSDLLRSFWKVAGFLPMQPEHISKNMIFGKPQPQVAMAKLDDLSTASSQAPKLMQVPAFKTVSGKLRMP